MAKETRTAEQKRQQRKEMRRARRREKKQEVLIALAAVAAAAAVIAGVVFGVNALQSSGLLLRAQTAMASPHYTVNNAMMTCFVQDSYASYLQTNAAYLSYIDLDTTKPLSEQMQGEGTWLDYFTDAAEQKVRRILLLAEAANEAGVTLDESEQAALEEQVVAAEPSDYGSGINRDDIRACLELSAVAAKYEQQVIDSLTCTDEDIDAYYEQNPSLFVTVDYMSFDIGYETDGETQAKAFAEELASCTDKASFRVWVKTFLDKYAGYSEDEVQEELDALIVQADDYLAGDEASEWMFADGRAVGDTLILQDSEDQSFSVYLLLSLPAQDESPTVAIREILLTSSTYGSIEDAAEQAQMLVEEWTQNGGDEEAFAALAKIYSEDASSRADGGLYCGVDEDSLSEELSAWYMDSARTAGELGTVETDYGCYLLYFVGEDLPRWRADARELILDEAYDALLSEWTQTYSVTVDDAAIAKIRM